MTSDSSRRHSRPRRGRRVRAAARAARRQPLTSDKQAPEISSDEETPRDDGPPAGKGGAQPPDAYAADVLTDNRQILMNTFLSNVVALVARCASEAAGDRARGEQSRGLYTLAEGGPGEGDEEEEGRGGGAAAGRPPAGEPWKAAAGVGGAGNSSSSNRPEEKSAVQDPLEQQRLKRAFVESVEYGDLP